MTRNDSRPRGRHRLRAIAGVGLLVAFAACGFNGVDIPELVGPAELATSIALTANPDLLQADGFSTSLVTATVRDQNGQPAAGRDIFFSIADASGRTADIGNLQSPSTGVGVGTGLSIKTNAQGVAAVVYEVPPRTDANGNQQIRVTARPAGTDASSALYRSVNIELRAAESRLFPQNPNNKPPVCGFTVEATGKSSCTGGAGGTIPTCTVPLNTSVLFQSTSYDPDGTIVRYFWNFGNGKSTDSPDASTSYGIPLTYVVTHLVTDNNGAQSACTTTIIAK